MCEPFVDYLIDEASWLACPIDKVRFAKHRQRYPLHQYRPPVRLCIDGRGVATILKAASDSNVQFNKLINDTIVTASGDG